MKCSAFEKRIYLYNELTPQEREETGAHITTCSHCTQLRAQIVAAQKIIDTTESRTPSLLHHAAMTHRIMDAVADLPRKKRFPFVKRFLSLSKISNVRYHMAVISGLLVVFFASEYMLGGEETRIIKPHRGIPGPKTTLNLASFHSAFQETRHDEEKRLTLFADCVASCLHVPDPDCKDCENKFRNHN